MLITVPSIDVVQLLRYVVYCRMSIYYDRSIPAVPITMALPLDS